MKKRVFFLMLIFGAVFAFSGCTLQGKPDGGVFKSLDGGETFSQKVKINEKSNLANANVLSLVFDPHNSQTLYLGTRRMGLYRSTDGGETWVRDKNNYQNIRDIQIDPRNSDVIYITAVVNGRGKIFKTTTGGNEWKEIFTERGPGPFIYTIALDKNNPDVIYVGDSQGGIYKSFDGGETWKSLFWNQGGIVKIVPDSANSQKLYFVTAKEKILKTTDGGSNFEEIKAKGTIYNFVAHPRRGEVFYLSDDEGLKITQDGGGSWQVLNTLVKPENLRTTGIAINPNNDREIFYSSGAALYKSTNGGETWKTTQFNVSRSIDIILINPDNDNEIYVGVDQPVGQSSSLLPPPPF